MPSYEQLSPSRAVSFLSKKARTASIMCSGSAMRPLPCNPLAKKPLSASTNMTPRDFKVSKLACVAGCEYMSKSIAGAAITGQRADKQVVVSRLSAMPDAILANVFAVAGAIIIKSAQMPNLTWLCHSPLVGSKNSVYTGFFDKVDIVSVLMNRLAFSVIITFTSAPSFTNARTRYALL